jgi:hypothetical protein
VDYGVRLLCGLPAADRSSNLLHFDFSFPVSPSPTAMPVHWKIDPQALLITARAEGTVTRPEFEAFLDAMAEADAVGYAKLFDGRGADTEMGAANIMAIGVRIKAMHDARPPDRPPGPVAIVLDADKFGLVARVLGILATARRQMRVFEELEPAREWIGKQRAFAAAAEQRLHREPCS